MKPKILHLLSDRNVGGVTATLESIVRSRLSEEFEFLVFTISEALPQLKQLQPDLIVWHDACAWKKLLTLWGLTWHSKVLIYEHHYSQGFEQHQVPSPFRFRWMLRIAYGLCDRVVAISFAQASWMRQYRLAVPPKLELIQQCRTLEDFFAVEPKPITLPLVFGVYGRFSKQKGIDILMAAMQMIPEVKIQLLVGGYGEDEEKLRHMAQGDDRIQFVGKLEHVPHFLAQCDAIIIPSRWEPWGNVCLEVKAAGKPVIVSQVDGLTEQVQDCGLLVPPSDPEALAQAIATLCQTPPATLSAWGEHGREIVRDAWENYLIQWEALYWQLLKPSLQTYASN